MTNPEELREKVARAMAVKDSGPEGSTLFDFHWREFGHGYLSSADAAISLVLEEAARVALEYKGIILPTRDIAAAIRALMPSKP